MTEFYDQTRKSNTQLSSLLISDFALMCSFILSHPLYFSYFIFFSPYLLKLLSFLSPLFITTTLLLLALLTLSSPSLLHPQVTADSSVCFLHSVLEKLQSRGEDNDKIEDFSQFLELEAYNTLFETSTFELNENPVEDLVVSEVSGCNSEAYPVEISLSEMSDPIKEGDCLEGSVQENTQNVEEKEVIKSITYFDKVEEQKEEPPPPPFMRSGSKAKDSSVSHSISKITENNNVDGDYQYTSKARENSGKLGTDSGGEYTSKSDEKSETNDGSLRSFGSMRKEKEWKRTLACKLFEERHNVDGGEGMDSLWEMYETDSNKVQPKNNTKKGKKIGFEYNYENDEEDEEVDGQLCCLQALKFSSGKMTLGMGKPNLMRFSKALKGFGWLHHVSSSKSKHGKKGCN